MDSEKIDEFFFKYRKDVLAMVVVKDLCRALEDSIDVSDLYERAKEQLAGALKEQYQFEKKKGRLQ